MDKASAIIHLSSSLSRELSHLRFSFGGVVCNPLEYAWDNYRRFLELSGREGQKIFFAGMNPGPVGMMQTGVPFGEIDAVKEYLGITGSVGKPERESPFKPVEGMNTRHHEVSGKKFWAMAAAIGDRDTFFSYAAVLSYCPLCFIEGRRNVTPEELPREDREALYSVCDRYFREILDILSIPASVALGHFAEKCLVRAGAEKIIYFPHPSPRNPASMKFWDTGEAKRRTEELIFGEVKP